MRKICGTASKSDAIKQMLNECKIAHVGIYHNDSKLTESDKKQADVCLTLPFKMELKGEIGAKEIAGGRYAAFLYRGTYEKLGEVYDTIFGKYLSNEGYQLDERPVSK